MMRNLLLPCYYKFAGIFLVSAGIVLAIFYIWFDFNFTLPVFAVFSSFMETKIFATFRTNFADELILLLLVAGFGLIVFSKEKHETEKYDSLRLRSLFKAMLVNAVFMLFSLLFIYGAGFLAVLIFNLVSLQLFYLVFFFFARKYHR
jgi:hypothetical protein